MQRKERILDQEGLKVGGDPGAKGTGGEGRNGTKRGNLAIGIKLTGWGSGSIRGEGSELIMHQPRPSWKKKYKNQVGTVID